ncbi:MAG: hypothetical protein F083_2535 [bacterium F083]|nr:MAG: hypothetical protein F083_2535 [bacterium F083]
MVGIIQRGLRLVLRIVDTIDYLVSLDDILYGRILCLAYFLLNRKNLVLRFNILDIGFIKFIIMFFKYSTESDFK